MYHSVSIVPVRPGGEILLQLRDDRPDLVNANCWSTLGGSVEPGETPKAAAWRELEEEVGRRPRTLVPAGFVDAPSPSIPGATLRIHLFGTSVIWPLENLTIGEGQGVDWIQPGRLRNLALAPPVDRAIDALLGSSLYQRLAAKGPTRLRKKPEPLHITQMLALGVRPGDLLAVQGASASFMRATWDVIARMDARISASPADWERPTVLLWWPSRQSPAEFLRLWCPRLTRDGVLWVIRNHLRAGPGIPTNDEIGAAAAPHGLIEDEVISLGGEGFAWRFPLLSGTTRSYAIPFERTPG